MVAVWINRLRPADAQILTKLFAAFADAGYDKFFHPHPFEAATAALISHHNGADYYCAGISDGMAVSYGFLRGYEAGYAKPSLGIAVHPQMRGNGYAGCMMLHLHDVAQRRHSPGVRLKVYPNNDRAIRLYKHFGYIFSERLENEQCVGSLEFAPPELGRTTAKAK